MHRSAKVWDFIGLWVFRLFFSFNLGLVLSIVTAPLRGFLFFWSPHTIEVMTSWNFFIGDLIFFHFVAWLYVIPWSNRVFSDSKRAPA